LNKHIQKTEEITKNKTTENNKLNKEQRNGIENRNKTKQRNNLHRFLHSWQHVFHLCSSGFQCFTSLPHV